MLQGELSVHFVRGSFKLAFFSFWMMEVGGETRG